jgi:hypothetical protein
MKIYVTYGYGSNLRDNYSVVEGQNEMECYNKIGAICNGAYSFSYKEEEFEGQAEKYGLTEVPLQAQVMRK